MDTIKELSKLKNLLVDGTIDENEFNILKKEIFEKKSVFKIQ